MNLDLLSLLITQTWQITLLILIVLATTRLVAKNRPHLAHILWVLVLLKCLTPPLWSSPTSAFSWMAADDLSEVSTSIVVAPQPKSLIETKSFLDPIVVHAVPQTDDPESDSLTTLFSRSAKSSPSISPATVAVDWSKSLSLIWIVGAGVGILVTTIRFLLFLRWIRRSGTIDDPAVDEAVQGLAKSLGIRRRVHVKTLNSPVGPAVLGLFRPTILLPASIVREKTPEQLEPLIAHELIHIRRGDLWWAMIQTIAKSMFWFHPLVWFAARMLTRESERSCDEETVACLGCDPSTYVKGLLEVLEHKHRLRVAPALPGVRPVDITSARLERVMNLGNGIHRRTPAWVWLVLIVGCSMALPGAALVFGQERLPAAHSVDDTGPQPARQPKRTDDQNIPILCDLPIIGKLFRNSTEDVTQLPKTSSLPPGLLLNPPAALPTDSSVNSRSNEPKLRVETYDIGELISDLRKWNVTAPASGHNMTALPLVMLGCRFPGKNGESSTPNCRQAQLATAHGVIILGNQYATMQLVGNRLYVFGTDRDHAQVTRLINQFRRCGFRQVVVETRILKMPTEQLVDLEIDWSIAPVAANGVIDDSLIEQTSYNPKNINDYSSLLIGSNAWSGNFNSDIADPGNHREIATASYVEKNSPVLYATLDREEVQTIISRMKSDIESTLLQAPTVTMFNGQNASIVSGSQKPFVVGLNRVEDKTGNAFALQPVIRLINDGIVLNLNAEIIKGEGVNLDCRLECSTVLSVDTLELPIKDAQKEPAKIQVPEVATTRIQSSLDVPPGKTLVLSCVQRKKDGESELFMAFLTCYLPDSENPEARRQSINTPPPAQPKPLEVIVDRDGNGELVPANEKNGYPQEKESLQLTIRSKESGQSDIDYQPLIETMKSHDVAIFLEGNVEYEINCQMPTVRGNELCISTDDGQLRLTGDQGEMKVFSEEHFVYRFVGNVEFLQGDVSMCADELTFDPAIGFQMSGSVVIKADEGGDARWECSADKIRIDSRKQTMTLWGKARYIRDGNHRADIQAEYIEVNLETDEIKSSVTIPDNSEDQDLFHCNRSITR